MRGEKILRIRETFLDTNFGGLMMRHQFGGRKIGLLRVTMPDAGPFLDKVGPFVSEPSSETELKSAV